MGASPSRTDQFNNQYIRSTVDGSNDGLYPFGRVGGEANKIPTFKKREVPRFESGGVLTKLW